jgi:Ydr279p protein triple barrel domain
MVCLNMSYDCSQVTPSIPATLDAFRATTNSETSNKPSTKHGNAYFLSFFTLPHPRTGEMISCVNHRSLTRPLGHPALFLPFKDEGAENIATTQILEAQAVDPPASRSWFMDDDIILEDGRLLLMTPIDPAFLLLPVLRSIASVSPGSPPRTSTNSVATGRWHLQLSYIR